MVFRVTANHVAHGTEKKIKIKLKTTFITAKKLKKVKGLFVAIKYLVIATLIQYFPLITPVSPKHV